MKVGLVVKKLEVTYDKTKGQTVLNSMPLMYNLFITFCKKMQRTIGEIELTNGLYYNF